MLSVLRSLVHVIWPAVCPVCGKIGVVACRSCIEALASAPMTICAECGGPSPCAQHPDGPTCVGAARYDDVCRRTVHAMKYKNARAIASMMGTAVALALSPPDADLLVSVPLHRGSRRGYDQAWLMARAMSRIWGIDARDALRWRVDISRQALKSSDERILPKDAIMLKDDLSGYRRVCIVDDLFTTGSTYRAAASAVSGAGVRVTGAVVWSIC